MSESLLIAGVVCIVASIVGGGIKLLGAEVPVLNSFARQALLFAVGAGFLFASFRVGDSRSAAPAPSPPIPARSPAQAPAQTAAPTPAPAPLAASPAASAPIAPAGVAAPCGESTALSCLPRSSAPVVFADPPAANRAAAQNIRDGLSTTQAQADAVRDGASGRASRLCGILASSDSSPLGKHLAALRLNNPQPTDGQPSPACLKLAESFF